jgi:hypothetical protein
MASAGAGSTDAGSFSAVVAEGAIVDSERLALRPG